MSAVSIYLLLFVYLFLCKITEVHKHLLFLELHDFDSDGMDLCIHIIQPMVPVWNHFNRPASSNQSADDLSVCGFFYTGDLLRVKFCLLQEQTFSRKNQVI